MRELELSTQSLFNTLSLLKDKNARLVDWFILSEILRFPPSCWESAEINGLIMELKSLRPDLRILLECLVPGTVISEPHVDYLVRLCFAERGAEFYFFPSLANSLHRRGAINLESMLIPRLRWRLNSGRNLGLILALSAGGLKGYNTSKIGMLCKLWNIRVRIAGRIAIYLNNGNAVGEIAALKKDFIRLRKKNTKTRQQVLADVYWVCSNNYDSSLLRMILLIADCFGYVRDAIKCFPLLVKSGNRLDVILLEYLMMNDDHKVAEAARVARMSIVIK